MMSNKHATWRLLFVLNFFSTHVEWQCLCKGHLIYILVDVCCTLTFEEYLVYYWWKHCNKYLWSESGNM